METEKQENKPQNKRKPRIIGKILLFSAIFMVLVLLLLPSFISSGAGKAIILSIANSGSGQKIEIEKISVGWFGNTKIDAILIKDENQNTLVDIEKVDINRSLLNLAMNWQNFGDIIIEKAKISVYLPETKEISPEPKDKKPDESPSSEPTIPDLTGSVTIKDSQVTIINHNGNKYGLEQINVKLTTADHKAQLNGSMLNSFGGVVNLEGVELILSNPISLIIKDSLQLLDQINIDQAIADDFLAELNPIFANQANLSGKISLRLNNIALPLNENLKEQATGSFVCDLESLVFQPEGFVATILDLCGAKKSSYKIDIKGLQALVKNGMVEYDNLNFRISDEIQIRFFGSSSLTGDDMNLKMAFPVTAELLGKAGIRSSDANRYASSLANNNVIIDIVGGKSNPQLDLSNVPQQIQNLIVGGVTDLIKDETKSQIQGQLDKIIDKNLEDDKKDDLKKQLENILRF